MRVLIGANQNSAAKTSEKGFISRSALELSRLHSNGAVAGSSLVAARSAADGRLSSVRFICSHRFDDNYDDDDDDQ